MDVGHGHADDLWVKLVEQTVWLAMALAVLSRLWVGGGISPHRERARITRVIEVVWACAKHLDILVCVEGLRSDVTAVLQVGRSPLRTDRPERSRLVLPDGLRLG